MTRRILFVTGTRADFGKLAPLAAVARDGGFAVQFFITGMHMMKKYGHTVREVRRFEGAEFHEFINQKDGEAHDLVMAKTMLGFSDWVTEERPDLVVVHGDRIETMSAAMVCATRYIPCAHIEGGEVSGTIDEIYRHCTTKLCRYHFVSSEQAAARILSLGEDTADVFVIGSPELDAHRAPSGVTLDEVRARYEIGFDEYGIAVFHPVTSEFDSMAEQARALFGTLAASGRNFVVISPNNDPGSEHIFAAIADLPAERFRHLPSMRFHHFSELMRNASAIVGNSSLGVREAPFLSVPSLDVGTRQSNRALSASVVNAAATDRGAILAFLDAHWGKRVETDRSFGQGNAAERFIGVLNSDAFWERGRQKVFVDRAG